MRFDDRLDTVLSQPAAGTTMQRIQFRQLLDLLGAAPAGAMSAAMDAASARLAELSQAIPAQDRAAMLGDPGLRLRNPQLIALLMAGEGRVAAAAAAKADLSDEQWLDLIPALPVRLRGLIRQRAVLGDRPAALLDRLGVPRRALPAAEAAGAPAVGTGTDDRHGDEPIEEIGAIVRRIEAYRRTRGQGAAEPAQHGAADDAAHAPPPGPVDLFDFATDADGAIVWADRDCAPAVVGLRLAARDADSPLQIAPALIQAFRHRQPIRGGAAAIDGAPAVAGHWRIDAMPRFDRPAGRFAGYIGRMRRVAEGAAAIASETADDAGDRMRQMLHELRTPVNAIQGFAEVLLLQIYGPTPHEYRALAAAIAGDGARILAGFDELDRLVKLESDALQLDLGESDLAGLVNAALAQLAPATAARGSGFLPLLEDESAPVTMARADAERLVWRLLATLANHAGAGEMLRLRLRRRGGEVRLTVRLPASLATVDEDPPSATGQQQPLSAGMFGAGFALRLAASEARAAGGALERRGDKLRLVLPGLTASDARHSQASGAQH